MAGKRVEIFFFGDWRPRQSTFYVRPRGVRALTAPSLPRIGKGPELLEALNLSRLSVSLSRATTPRRRPVLID